MQNRPKLFATQFTPALSVSLMTRAIASRSHAYINALLISDVKIGGDNTLLHTVITTYVKAIQNAPVENRDSLWHEADQLIRSLVARGVNINAGDDKGQTALHLAAMHEGIFEDTLIELGAQLNMMDNDGAFILEHVIMSMQRLEKYIIAGANVRSTNLQNETIMHRLVHLSVTNAFSYSRYTAIMRLCILHGADINAVDKFGRTPLQLAAKNGCINIVRAILNLQVAAIYDSIEFNGESPAEMNADYDQLERTMINIAVRVNMDHQDNDGRTALMDSSDKRISALLIVFGANVTLVDGHHQTTLSCIRAKHDDETEALLMRADEHDQLLSAWGGIFYQPLRPSSPASDTDDECISPRFP